MYGDFPAKNTVYTPYICGPGQPYVCHAEMTNGTAVRFVRLRSQRKHEEKLRFV
jgi:hypothetical protein